MRACGITDVGQTRKMNQDYIFFSDEPIGNLPNLYIVADGMGGHKAGEYASKFSVERFTAIIHSADSENLIGLLEAAIKQVNQELYKESAISGDHQGMGTTFVAAVIKNNILYAMNIGDSRIYVIGDNITQISIDHSLVEEMIRSGKLERNQMRNHPDKNYITRAIGAEEHVVADFFEVDLEPNQRILLCSDGLTNMVLDDEIEEIINNGLDIRTTAQKLIERANYYGGKDNITALVIEQE